MWKIWLLSVLTRLKPVVRSAQFAFSKIQLVDPIIFGVLKIEFL